MSQFNIFNENYPKKIYFYELQSLRKYVFDIFCKKDAMCNFSTIFLKKSFHDSSKSNVHPFFSFRKSLGNISLQYRHEKSFEKVRYITKLQNKEKRIYIWFKFLITRCAYFITERFVIFQTEKKLFLNFCFSDFVLNLLFLL